MVVLTSKPSNLEDNGWNRLNLKVKFFGLRAQGLGRSRDSDEMPTLHTFSLPAAKRDGADPVRSKLLPVERIGSGEFCGLMLILRAAPNAQLQADGGQHGREVGYRTAYTTITGPKGPHAKTN